VNWSIVGWVVIGLAAFLLVLFTFLNKKTRHLKVRKITSIDRLVAAQSDAIERGQPRLISLGDQLWSRTYPGLSLHTLTVLPMLVDAENVMADGMFVSSGEGSLVALARQIVQNDYSNGFLTELSKPGVNAILPGPTKFSYLAGLLSEIGLEKYGSVTLFGNYGPEAAVWVEAVQSKGGYVFAGAGPITAQAALFTDVEDLLIGESLYAVSGSLNTARSEVARLMVEDIIRILLILSLLAGVIMKLVGVV